MNNTKLFDALFRPKIKPSMIPKLIQPNLAPQSGSGDALKKTYKFVPVKSSIFSTGFGPTEAELENAEERGRNEITSIYEFLASKEIEQNPKIKSKQLIDSVLNSPYKAQKPVYDSYLDNSVSQRSTQPQTTVPSESNTRSSSPTREIQLTPQQRKDIDDKFRFQQALTAVDQQLQFEGKNIKDEPPKELIRRVRAKEHEILQSENEKAKQREQQREEKKRQKEERKIQRKIDFVQSVKGKPIVTERNTKKVLSELENLGSTKRNQEVPLTLDRRQQMYANLENNPSEEGFQIFNSLSDEAINTMTDDEWKFMKDFGVAVARPGTKNGLKPANIFIKKVLKTNPKANLKYITSSNIDKERPKLIKYMKDNNIDVRDVNGDWPEIEPDDEIIPEENNPKSHKITSGSKSNKKSSKSKSNKSGSKTSKKSEIEPAVETFKNQKRKK